MKNELTALSVCAVMLSACGQHKGETAAEVDFDELLTFTGISTTAAVTTVTEPVTEAETFAEPELTVAVSSENTETEPETEITEQFRCWDFVNIDGHLYHPDGAVLDDISSYVFAGIVAERDDNEPVDGSVPAGAYSSSFAPVGAGLYYASFEDRTHAAVRLDKDEYVSLICVDPEETETAEVVTAPADSETAEETTVVTPVQLIPEFEEISETLDDTSAVTDEVSSDTLPDETADGTASESVTDISDTVSEETSAETDESSTL